MRPERFCSQVSHMRAKISLALTSRMDDKVPPVFVSIVPPPRGRLSLSTLHCIAKRRIVLCYDPTGDAYAGTAHAHAHEKLERGEGGGGKEPNGSPLTSSSPMMYCWKGSHLLPFAHELFSSSRCRERPE
jgi:hypothetical protein